MKKRLSKIKLEDSSPSEPEDNDSENIKYFLNLLGLSQYYQVLSENKICSLAKLRGNPTETQKWTRRRPKAWGSR